MKNLLDWLKMQYGTTSISAAYTNVIVIVSQMATYWFVMGEFDIQKAQKLKLDK